MTWPIGLSGERLAASFGEPCTKTKRSSIASFNLERIPDLKFSLHEKSEHPCYMKGEQLNGGN